MSANKPENDIYTYREFLAVEFPHYPEVIGEGILRAGATMMIFGGAGTKKSLLALHLCHCLATGTKWFGYPTSYCVPFKYQTEMPPDIDQSRLRQFSSGLNGLHPENLLLKTNLSIKINTPYGSKSLESDIKLIHNRFPNSHIVLILDPIYLSLSGSISDEENVSKFLAVFNDIRSVYGISVILIHHSHKLRVDANGNLVNTGQDEIMGSSYLRNWSNTIIRIEDEGEYKSKIEFWKHNNARKKLYPFEITWNEKTLHPKLSKHLEVESTEDITVKGLK